MSFDFSTASDSTTDALSYFSDRGEDYEKYRPNYPASAIDTILSGLGSPTQITAVDVGAGTGIGARLLADRGVRVVAIEPNEDMRRAATPHEGVDFLVFWQGFWLPYFTNLRRHKFVSSQDLDFTGLVGLARSQGFTPSEGKGLEKLMSDLAVFHQRFCDRRGLVRLSYRTHLYIAISN